MNLHEREDRHSFVHPGVDRIDGNDQEDANGASSERRVVPPEMSVHVYEGHGGRKSRQDTADALLNVVTEQRETKEHQFTDKTQHATNVANNPTTP